MEKSDTDVLPDGLSSTATKPAELVELRDAYTKHYRSPEGQYYAEVHAQPVHYKQGGAWKDYDLSLQAKETEDGYFVRGTDTPVTFPQNFADGGKITVSHGTYSVGFGVSAANAGFNAKSSARTMSKTEDTSGVSDELRYAKVLPNVDFTYTALPNGVKENVIVHKKQKSYRYTFDMDFGGLLPVKQEDGSIYLMVSANAKKPTFILDMPYMVDDAGQYSEAVTMTVQGTRLTLEADAEWMNASDRAFPVTIDPYCYVPTGSSSYIRSTYVTNLHPNQNYYGKVSTGRNGLYADRTYFKFSFPALPENGTFYRASLTVYQIFGMHSGAQNYIDLYDLSAYDEWERSEITWNDQPVGSAFGAYAGTPRVDSCVLSTATDAVYTFNISSIAEAHYDDEEEDNGYLLAMRREDAGEFSWMGDVGGPNGTP
ncbi:MAG: DNRLRE domain-containing protein, partial [Clostridia bacterium]|nr:DNRLRE domain-containing protein [Clostridia bacterium]